MFFLFFVLFGADDGNAAFPSFDVGLNTDGWLSGIFASSLFTFVVNVVSLLLSVVVAFGGIADGGSVSFLMWYLSIHCISSVGTDDCNKSPPNGAGDADSAQCNNCAFVNFVVSGVNDTGICNVGLNCCCGSFVAVLLLFAIDVLLAFVVFGFGQHYYY